MFRSAMRNNEAAFTGNSSGNSTVPADAGVGSAIASYRNDYRRAGRPRRGASSPRQP
jgi:hypothetical protein